MYASVIKNKEIAKGLVEVLCDVKIDEIKELTDEKFLMTSMSDKGICLDILLLKWKIAKLI